MLHGWWLKEQLDCKAALLHSWKYTNSHTYFVTWRKHVPWEVWQDYGEPRLLLCVIRPLCRHPWHKGQSRWVSAYRHDSHGQDILAQS